MLDPMTVSPLRFGADLVDSIQAYLSDMCRVSTRMLCGCEIPAAFELRRNGSNVRSRERLMYFDCLDLVLQELPLFPHNVVAA